jgi:chaperone modulatory protein CbpM
VRIEITEGLWLDDASKLSLAEMEAWSGLTAAELRQLIECDALTPVAALEAVADADIAEARFSAHCLALARAASRLRDDFDLDANGLALALRLLNRIRELEAELHHARVQWPR